MKCTCTFDLVPTLLRGNAAETLCVHNGRSDGDRRNEPESSQKLRKNYLREAVCRFLDGGHLSPHDFNAFFMVQNEVSLLHRDFVLYGGYPRIALEPDSQIRTVLLREIANTFIQRDLLSLIREDHLPQLRALLQALSTSLGQILNLSDLQADLGLSYAALKRYLFLLEGAFITRSVPPYARNLRKVIRKSPKVYFLDTGLRNLFRGSFEEADGGLWENAAWQALLKSKGSEGQSLFFYRTQNGVEGEFILERTGEIVPIEVKATAMAAPRLPRGLWSFIRKVSARRAILLNARLLHLEERDGVQMLWLPHEVFGLI